MDWLKKYLRERGEILRDASTAFIRFAVVALVIVGLAALATQCS